MSGGDDVAGSGNDGTDDGYTAEVEEAFMGECTVQGSRASCECAWDEVTETIPFDRFTEIEAELAADPDAEVEELTTIIDACMGAG